MLLVVSSFSRKKRTKHMIGNWFDHPDRLWMLSEQQQQPANSHKTFFNLLNWTNHTSELQLKIQKHVNGVSLRPVFPSTGSVCLPVSGWFRLMCCIYWEFWLCVNCAHGRLACCKCFDFYCVLHGCFTARSLHFAACFPASQPGYYIDAPLAMQSHCWECLHFCCPKNWLLYSISTSTLPSLLSWECRLN